MFRDGGLMYFFVRRQARSRAVRSQRISTFASKICGPFQVGRFICSTYRRRKVGFERLASVNL